jgi:hypothetical protein
MKPSGSGKDWARSAGPGLCGCGAGDRDAPTGDRDAAGRTAGCEAVGAAGAAVNGGGVKRATALGRGAPVAAALCPFSVTGSAIASPAATSTPAASPTPERKLISSMRA